MPLNPLPHEPQSRDAFLKSVTRTKGYKRYSGLPLRYGGGKSLAVGAILEHFPSGLEKLVSPFIGGGSVEVACAKELGIRVEGYDVFDILVNYWQVQLQRPKHLATLIQKWKPNKKDYALVKTMLKGHWKQIKRIEKKELLAASYWFNHNLSYGPGFLGWMSKIYEDPSRFERLVKKVSDFRCPNLAVKCGSFEKVIPKHKEDFLYCDPPYYLDGDSKMFKGIYPMRNFPIHHRGFEHRLLCDVLHAHEGGFVLSYNDCSTIREWYGDCRIVEVSWQYTLGQGETRIGKNRLESGGNHVKPSHELLIIGEKNG